MNYARAVKVARALRRVSQTDLASRIGKSSGYVSLIESGSRTPSLKTLEAISAALEVPLHLMFLLSTRGSDLEATTAAQFQAAAEALLTLLVSAEEAPVER